MSVHDNGSQIFRSSRFQKLCLIMAWLLFLLYPFFEASAGAEQGTVSGKVFLDFNNNHTFESSDQLLSDHPVELFSAEAHKLVASAITNNLGEYVFSNVSDGQYYVKFAGYAGSMFCIPRPDEVYGSDANPSNGMSEAFTLNNDNATVELNAGIDLPPTVTLLSWFLGKSLSYDDVLLKWETASEIDGVGFNLYKAASPNDNLVLINNDIIPSFMLGSPMGMVYEFEDHPSAPGPVYYWLEYIHINGIERFGPILVDNYITVFLPVIEIP